jgi:hypothetical protein
MQAVEATLGSGKILTLDNAMPIVENAAISNDLNRLTANYLSNYATVLAPMPTSVPSSCTSSVRLTTPTTIDLALLSR